MRGDGIHLVITIGTPNGDVVAATTARLTDRVADVIVAILRDNRLAGGPGEWQLLHEGRVLDQSLTLRDVLPAGLDRASLSLRPVTPARFDRARLPGSGGGGSRGGPGGGYGGAAPAAPPQAAPPAPASPAALPPPTRDEDEDLDAEFELGEGAEREPPIARGKYKKRAKGKTEQRRATVRYYSRMNPDRVFPLLVMLTRQQVEEVVKRHVEQKATGPLKLDKDTPIEIEPVLPGCDVYPPKVVTRLGAADQAFTFHVVPHVLGDVTGARVFVRQNHATLAEIALDVRVVQRTWVLASGLSTVFLPMTSAAMRHFGWNFTPTDGTNLYLAVLDFLFGQVSPVVLTAALAALTALAWWLTRPKGRDVFWDISTKPAGDGK